MRHHKFMLKIFEEIKNHGPTTDWKYPLWRIKNEYKVLPSSNQPIILDHLTSSFTFSLSPSSSKAHLESTPSSISASSLIHRKIKWIFA